MNTFQITLLPDASLLAMDDMRSQIHINPDYQRPGGVWNLRKRQLFIDSLLNRYDIPKLYFHQIDGSDQSPAHKFAIIDGRQRLEAIWSFVDGDFALADDFEYYDDSKVAAGGMTYQELSQEHPRLITRLHSRTLSVVVVAAEEVDVVEDMFSRLNEAVPLNAAEKRNAFGGALPLVTRRLVQHPFFEQRISVPPTRYRHHDIAAKFLYLESNKDIVDTKKASLDAFFLSARETPAGDFDQVERRVNANLDEMDRVFVETDVLLRSSGMTVVYYVLLSRLRRARRRVRVNRAQLVDFDRVRAKNRERFENDEDNIDRRLIEFDELARSSNDGAAIRERYEVLRRHLAL